MKNTFGTDDGNMIIHGDNLEALKALLPGHVSNLADKNFHLYGSKHHSHSILT